MLTAIMSLFGIDLEQKVLLLKGHVQDAVEETGFRFRRELQAAGMFVIFAGLGAVALAAAMGTGAAALFLWLDDRYGPFVALAAVGGLCAFFAAVMFMFAMVRRRPHKTKTTAAPSKTPAPPKPATASTMPHRAQPAPIPLSIAPLAEGASLVDQLTHRYGQRALAASDEAVERAEAYIREGSSGAVLTTLAVAAVIGVVIGHRRGLHQ